MIFYQRIPDTNVSEPGAGELSLVIDNNISHAYA